MLTPFSWAVLTIEEAKVLMDFIEKSTATKGLTRNYDKMSKAGVLTVYNSLREFVEANAQYESNLRNLNTDDFARDDHDHDGHRSYH